MVQKKDNLPVNTDPVVNDGGTISYANEVIAIISGIAASEIEGIAGMVTTGGLGEIISKNRNITRGVKVEVGTEEVSVDLYTIVEYGQPIQKVASEVQENVRKSIESMTGLKVVRVDIHVQGVSFEKDKKDTASRIEAAHIQHISDSAQEKKNKQAEKEAKELETKAADEKAAKEADAKKEDKPEAPKNADDEATVKADEKQAAEAAPEKPAAKKPAPARSRKKAPAPKNNKA
ncbi:MAG: Asp23/Gls24 family envelope stress response protein [Christensenellales bacterium]|jgi:uncharacterized alkaline shock family protein YloU|nr:Asp23/Gls24 family envelope stress response protein [Clostridiales bacterium]